MLICSAVSIYYVSSAKSTLYCQERITLKVLYVDMSRNYKSCAFHKDCPFGLSNIGIITSNTYFGLFEPYILWIVTNFIINC